MLFSGFPESSTEGMPDKGDPLSRSYTNAEALDKYFNIKTKDLIACKTDKNIEGNKDVSRTLKALSTSNEAQTPTERKDFQQILTNIVKAALPCAKNNKVTDHVTYYNDV